MTRRYLIALVWAAVIIGCVATWALAISFIGTLLTR
jgi:hypothetical protein